MSEEHCGGGLEIFEKACDKSAKSNVFALIRPECATTDRSTFSQKIRVLRPAFRPLRLSASRRGRRDRLPVDRRLARPEAIDRSRRRGEGDPWRNRASWIRLLLRQSL